MIDSHSSSSLDDKDINKKMQTDILEKLDGDERTQFKKNLLDQFALWVNVGLNMKERRILTGVMSKHV